MAADPTDQQQPPSFFNLLTLNTNRRADLAGLPTLLRENRPDFAFIQEVTVSLENLRAAVGGLGYTVWMSTCDQPRRTIAVLSIHSADKVTVTDPLPGYLQKVLFGNYVLFHIHAPTNPIHMDKTFFFQQVSNFVQQAVNLIPFLVGDFNCIINAIDAENSDIHNRFNRFLSDFITNENFIDSYRVLHPATVRYSWHRRGFAAVRLDCIYLPILLQSRPRFARYIPTASDHHAFILKLDMAGLGLPVAGRPSASLYWKLNSSLLKEGDFLPAFEEMWRPVAAAANTFPTGPAEWWESLAKPAISDFCRDFGRLVAGRQAATRRFYTRGLELALEAADWEAVASCKKRLSEHDARQAAGMAIRTGQPVAEGETPSLFQAAMEGRHGPSPGLTAIRTADGQVLREPDAVQQEILSYFEALFQGRHQASADRPEPFDSGTSFTPDLNIATTFLSDLPSLSPEQSESLEKPFDLQELEEAVEAAAASKSPGLDGLSYELYKVIFPLVGPPLLSALNHMLATGSLVPSMTKGVVRLLPKVKGIPTAAQLRPITLLNTDYKLLSKMLVNRFNPILPSILKTTQLCSVPGRTIFDGAAAVLSASTFLHQHQLPGYIVSLDFFHAYDRVCLTWVDLVLQAMGFGPTLRKWVTVLHKNATASFILHSLSPEVATTFSLRQGDPFALILFIIQEEPFLHRLQSLLNGLRFAGLREASLGYVDDVSVLSSKTSDLLVMDEVVSQYEAASGAILNRNRKSAVLGLGSWAGRTDWPLQWIHAANSIKLYGVHFAPDFPTTLQLSWDHTVSGLEATLRMWASRSLPFLAQRRQILHSYALSKLWYLAQILPLPKASLKRILSAASVFLWKGRLERLSWNETIAPLRAGGLGVASIETRARALLAKQACHRLAAGGRPRTHLSYWIGLRLLRPLPGLRSGLHAETPPSHYADLATLLLQVLDLDFVRPNRLKEVNSAALYKALLPDPPPPKIQLRLPTFPWPRIWGRLALPCLPQPLIEIGFSFLNNILTTGERRHRLRRTPTPACDHCAAPLDNILHTFTSCRRIADAWENIVYVASVLLGGPVSDSDLLFLKFPISTVEIHIIFAVLTFADMVWSTRAAPTPLSPLAVRARLAHPPPPFRSIFKLI